MEINIFLAIGLSIVVLLFLILSLKIQAFLALIISSLCAGLLAGMEPVSVLNSITQGMGGTLGFVATVVGLGALFGAILEHSGGTQAVAKALLVRFGENRAPVAMLICGFIIAIPVFFDVAFIILVPIIYALQKSTGKSLLLFGIPLLSGLAITHAFIPPTPGPVAVADILNADLGWVILAGFLAGIPAAIVSGLLWGRYIGNKVMVKVPDLAWSEHNADKPYPNVWAILAIIFVPIVLILFNTLSSSNIIFPENVILSFLGHPFVALILANLLAWYFLGVRRGTTSVELSAITSRSLAPAGTIILLTGAGGAFKQVLIDTGAGEVIAKSMGQAGISVLFFGFVVAAVVRILQGSATVAMITSAGVTAPLLEGPSDFQKALLVVAIASGASILSHVNDSGFWLVSRYFGMSERQTLVSWSVTTTIIAFTGFMTTLVLSWLF